MSDVIYQASVFEKTIKYVDFKGKTKEATLSFALDPIQLLLVIASFEEPKNKKSGNPAKRDQVEPITNEKQLEFVQGLVKKAAGWPSEDGESWMPYENFENDIAGKAFLTKLASSDEDRKEFAQKVVLDPFNAYVEYAKAEPSNKKADIDNLIKMQEQLTRIFSEPDRSGESLEERRARLEAELQAMVNPDTATD